MNEQGTNSYLNNPYVLLGGVLIFYWWYSRRNILKSNPNANSSISDLEASSFTGARIKMTAKKHRVPEKLVRDVIKMDKKEIAQMIIDNQKMINQTKMSNDERKHILKMVDYLEIELEKKM